MSGTEIAALIAALAFLLLVGVLMVPILKLRHTVDAATRALTELTEKSGPLLTDAHQAIDGVNTALGQMHTSLDGVNTQLERIDVITGHAQQVSGNVAQLSTIVSGVTSSPLVKAAAFGYGVRRAVNARRSADTEREVRGRVADEKRSARQTRKAARSGKQGRWLFGRSGHRKATATSVGEGND